MAPEHYSPSVMRTGTTEWKTKAATVAAFVVSLAGLALLASVDTDMIGALPDWLESPAYALVSAGIVWLTAYNTKHRPESMSASAIQALRERAAGRTPPSI